MGKEFEASLMKFSSIVILCRTLPMLCILSRIATTLSYVACSKSLRLNEVISRVYRFCRNFSHFHLVRNVSWNILRWYWTVEAARIPSTMSKSCAQSSVCVLSEGFDLKPTPSQAIAKSTKSASSWSILLAIVFWHWWFYLKFDCRLKGVEHKKENIVSKRVSKIKFNERLICRS